MTGPHNWLNGLHLFVDYLTTVPPRIQRLTAPMRRYPEPFRKVQVTARDGVKLAGWLGLAKSPNGARRVPRRDGILLVPGLWTSKDNHRIRARSVRLLEMWGYHVLALDARGVGGSERTFITPGWKEAQDLIDAVRFFRRAAPLRRVHLYAESTAASAAIIAAGLEGRAGRRLVDGRVLAMSAYADAQHIADLFSAPDPRRTELGADFVLVQKFFNALLRLQGYRGGRFDAYCNDAARHYGLSPAELCRRSSPARYIRDVNVPLLVVHSRDDGLVPVSEAERLAQLAERNPWAQVWILPWGYHCLYEMADPRWYWRLLEGVFEPRAVGVMVSRRQHLEAQKIA